MTILISDNSPRISYTATSGQTAFTVPFEFFDNTDLNVYINDTLQTLTTHYTVTGGDGSTGSITLVTGATAGDIVVITRDVTLERTTDFPTSGPFQVASLNTELDKVVAMIADMKDLADRGLRLSDSDTSATLVLANKDTRKGTVLAFNETTGAVEVGPTIADTNTIAQIKADIATLADIQDGTVATNAITTVSSISSDVTTVSSNNANVTTVAGQTTNMQNITNNLTAVQNAATNATNAAASATAAASSATAAATSETNAGTSETNAATSATNASNSASAASTSASAASTSATAAASSATAAAASETAAGTSETNAATSATNAATSATNAGTSETNAASSATAAAASATSASAAQTAAESARDSALAAYDNFDDRFLGTKTSDPTVDNDGDALVAGALYFNSTDGEMKVYNGTSWVDAYADGASLVSKSGDTMTGNLSFGDNNKAIFGAGSDLQIYHDGSNSYVQDAGTGDLILKGAGSVFLKSGADEVMLHAVGNGATKLNYDNATKLATTSTGIDVTGNINLGDNDKAIFGAGNDLEIYHDGTHSYISELTPTGSLFIDGSNIFLRSSGGEEFLKAVANAQVELYYDDQIKLATTSTGIDVTGTVTADGLTVDGLAAISAQTNGAYALRVGDTTGGSGSVAGVGKIGINQFSATSNTYTGTEIRATENSGGDYRARLSFHTRGSSSDVEPLERLRIDYNGDISFYEDTGTTAKLFWSASTESLGIGTSSPLVINGTTFSSGNHLHHTSSTHARIVASGSSSGQLLLNDTGASTDQKTKFIISDGGSLQFGKTSDAGSNTEQMRLENDADLHVDGNVVAYSTTISDIRLKKDIAPIEDAVTKVQQLNGCTFTYLKDDRKSAGLIAQDVEKVLPSAVIDDEAVFHGKEGETYKTVQYDQLIGLLVEAVKELKAEIEELKDASSK